MELQRAIARFEDDNEMARLEADNARLREQVRALREALKDIYQFTWDVPDDEPLSHVCATARAALAGSDATTREE